MQTTSETTQAMKIFLSWSGPRSRAVADVLREWLRKVLDHIEPWMSANDISKGSRWAAEIAGSLRQSTIGVVCVTPENREAPWILFEAGALSLLEDRYVCPFLFGLEPKDIDGPLDQFQITSGLNRDDTKKLISTINAALGVRKTREDLLSVAFDFYWQELEDKLKKIAAESNYKHARRQPGKPRKSDENEDRKVAKALKQHLLNQYGFKADRSTSTAEILDLAGTTRLKRVYQGIKVYSDITISHLPGSVQTSNDESEFLKPPSLIKPVPFKKPLSIVRRVPAPNGYQFQVRIKGGLKRADGKLTYAYESVLTKGFLMKKEAVYKAYKDSPLKKEYYSASADIPTDELVVEVVFPEGLKARPAPGVFTAGSEIMHRSELNRVEAGFQKTETGACFVIKQPLVGFNYLIHWLPLSAKSAAKRGKGPMRN